MRQYLVEQNKNDKNQYFVITYNYYRTILYSTSRKSQSIMKRFMNICIEADLTSITNINRYGVYSTTKKSGRKSRNFEDI